MRQQETAIHIFPIESDFPIESRFPIESDFPIESCFLIERPRRSRLRSSLR